jgi:DNA-binding NarL/FixJ family response regulator
MAMNYVNAEKVLPPDLVRRVRELCTGLIYFPADREFFERRRREILSLHKKRLPTDKIARRVHLCRRRVQQIIRERRDAGEPKGGR